MLMEGEDERGAYGVAYLCAEIRPPTPKSEFQPRPQSSIQKHQSMEFLWELNFLLGSNQALNGMNGLIYVEN